MYTGIGKDVIFAIGTMKSLAKWKHLLLMLNMLCMSKIGMKQINLSYHEHKSTGDSTTDLALELFAKLPKDLKKQLYELYKIDFEMFEYDVKPFL